jgi:hypothetical protein
MPQMKNIVGISIKIINFRNVIRSSPERHFLCPKSNSLQTPDCMSQINFCSSKSQKNARKIAKNLNPNR